MMLIQLCSKNECLCNFTIFLDFLFYFLQVLDACANNCGKEFRLEIASREFENEFRRILGRTQPKVQEKLRGLLKSWAEGEFKGDSQLSLIPSLYQKLKQEGVDFSSASDDPTSKKRVQQVNFRQYFQAACQLRSLISPSFCPCRL